MRKGTLSPERAGAMLEVLAEGEYPLPGEEPRPRPDAAGRQRRNGETGKGGPDLPDAFRR